jgi:serine-type D-Ala-D-Ala carboxypeptidase (penicillin-binding protein 5/6)
MPASRPLRARRAFARLTATVAASVALLVPATAAAAPVAPAPTAPPVTAPPPATPAPQSYLAFDGETGAIVAAANEHVPHLTASTIKVLTALVTLERLPMAAKLRVSALAASQPAMKISMTEGSAWPMDQALASLLMVSANDAAYAMAENVGGSVDGFAQIANKEAQRLGMRDTTFKDPAGLDGAQGFGGGSTSSAYDLAITARDALAVPAIADNAAKVTYEFTDPNGVGRRLTNHNKGFLTTYPGAVGLKTGYTEAASRTLLAAARRDGHTCGVALMGTWDDTGWAGYLLDQCFAGVRAAGAAPLPANRVRLAAATASTATALDGAGAAATTSTPPTTVPKLAAAKTPAQRTSAPASAGKAAPARTSAVAAAASTGAGSGSPWGNLLKAVGIGFLVLLVTVVVLRRRAVRRRRARRERMRALAEARRRGMIDVVEPDTTGSDLRVMPERTSHHVSASRRHQSDRRVVRPTRPRGHSPSNDRS